MCCTHDIPHLWTVRFQATLRGAEGSSGDNRCGGFRHGGTATGWFISWKIHENPITMDDLKLPPI